MRNRTVRDFPRTIAALVLALCIPACAPPPQSIGPTVQAQQQAIEAIAHAYADDLALSEALLRALLDIRRTILLGRLHRELIIRDYLTPAGEPDHAALEADLNTPDPPTALSREVVEGRMSLEEAHDWLAAYARTNDATARRELLGQLEPARNGARAEQAIFAAKWSRNASILMLFDSAQTASQALAHYAGASGPPTQPPTRDTVRRAFEAVIADHIDDPDRRAAAWELIEAILDLANTSSTGETQS
ncbi:MAG: hypothetical protein EA380_00055 [Phycisphaeraceae bacterium]|nr:MAG: hypothetical protein EA380_00055 [Phycisphaeraceae bacterium]